MLQKIDDNLDRMLHPDVVLLQDHREVTGAPETFSQGKKGKETERKRAIKGKKKGTQQRDNHNRAGCSQTSLSAVRFCVALRPFPESPGDECNSPCAMMRPVPELLSRPVLERCLITENQLALRTTPPFPEVCHLRRHLCDLLLQNCGVREHGASLGVLTRPSIFSLGCH